MIRINGKETGINTPIASNDRIEIQPSTIGKGAELIVGRLPEFKSTLSFVFNGTKVSSARLVLANGELVSEFYQLRDGDRIEVLDYCTLRQLLELMDIINYSNLTVNNMPADMDTKVYDNFTIQCDMEVWGNGADGMAGESQNSEDGVDGDAGEPHAQGMMGDSRDISITVNGNPVVLKNKENYILVDVLDFYPVDTSVAHGDHLEIEVDGQPCDFTHPVRPGASVRIEWVG